MGEIIDISPLQLSTALLFVLLAQAGSIAYKLGLGRDLFVGTFRTVTQLILMGYALKIIFRVDSAPLTLLVLLFMTGAASRIIKGRVSEDRVPFMIPMLLSMMAAYLLVSVYTTGLIIGAKPWWKPQYFLPIGGMIIGNSMNALSISLERLFSDLKTRGEIVEMRLTLGADYREASEDILRDAMRAGMIPSINSMMGVGLVFLPGMMTGQILAGADPLIAIKYQIIVMLMIVGATALSTLLVLIIVRKRCFGRGEQIVFKNR